MFFGHGLSKLTAGTARWEKLGHALTDLIGLDSFHIFFGFLASLSESIGALLVAFGLVTRFSSFFLFFTMAKDMRADPVTKILEFWNFQNINYHFLIAVRKLKRKT